MGAQQRELMQASDTGTVPVLVTATGGVVPESLDIMRLALEGADPQGWLAAWDRTAQRRMQALIEENDGPFKHHLDRHRYPQRFGAAVASAEHRRELLAILSSWNDRLQAGGWLLGRQSCLADWALLPFVRQFSLTEPTGWAAQAGLEALQGWLDRYGASRELATVMEPPWGLRRCWHSPRWIYHLALADDWCAARAEGVYAVSTRHRSIEQVGSLHSPSAPHIASTHQRFLAGARPPALPGLHPAHSPVQGTPVCAGGTRSVSSVRSSPRQVMPNGRPKTVGARAQGSQAPPPTVSPPCCTVRVRLPYPS